MSRPICEVCGTYEGTPHRGDCPLRDLQKWKRKTSPTSGGPAYVIEDNIGRVILHIHRKEACGHWYVYVGVGQDEPDGTRFNRLWEAKEYAMRQLRRGRVSEKVQPTDMVPCRECLEEFEWQELTDGVCHDCSREECEACGGTGMSDEYDDEDGATDCNECGGEGRI